GTAGTVRPGGTPSRTHRQNCCHSAHERPPGHQCSQTKRKYVKYARYAAPSEGAVDQAGAQVDLVEAVAVVVVGVREGDQAPGVHGQRGLILLPGDDGVYPQPG